MANKAQLIESIVAMNPSADRTWLSYFEAPALSLYEEHLQYALAPRSTETGWLRPTETPAVVCRTAA
ncbi:MAG: hypothetical protein EXS00_01975 [Phycisphaerales bacterium]|nr:hypothetical protein [Phycisphaerales bacterium]